MFGIGVFVGFTHNKPNSNSKQNFTNTLKLGIEAF
jgi:hypothetical protein